jgi:hypothetical protein
VTKKSGVPGPVIAAVKAWAQSTSPSSALADERRRLDPLLVPVLVEEVAEITAEQLLIALDMPSKAPPAPPGEVQDGPVVDFLGLSLSQTQARRVVVWLDEQQETAGALGLAPEVWSKKLADGFATAIAALKGVPSSTARAVGERLGSDPLAQASKGFAGGVDPRTSPQAGLRGMLAARSFKKP